MNNGLRHFISCIMIVHRATNQMEKSHLLKPHQPTPYRNPCLICALNSKVEFWTPPFLPFFFGLPKSTL